MIETTMAEEVMMGVKANRVKQAVAELKACTDAGEQKVLREKVFDLMADCLSTEAEEAVTVANSRIATTQNNYGFYMSALAGFSGMNLAVFVRALRKAGAGPGLDSALEVMKGG